MATKGFFSPGACSIREVPCYPWFLKGGRDPDFKLLGTAHRVEASLTLAHSDVARSGRYLPKLPTPSLTPNPMPELGKFLQSA